MRSFFKIMAYLSIIPLFIGLFFFSNIKGYYRFKDYCEKEGGLRVYEPLERNVGWLAKDKYDGRVVALLTCVGFVRYTDKKDGQTYDIRYISGDPQDDSSFEKNIADESKLFKYKWLHTSDLAGELLIGRSGYANTDKLLVRFYMFGFSWFDTDRTPLSTTVKDSCFHEYYESSDDFPKSRSLKEIISAFKN